MLHWSPPVVVVAGLVSRDEVDPPVAVVVPPVLALRLELDHLVRARGVRGAVGVGRSRDPRGGRKRLLVGDEIDDVVARGVVGARGRARDDRLALDDAHADLVAVAQAARFDEGVGRAGGRRGVGGAPGVLHLDALGGDAAARGAADECPEPAVVARARDDQRDRLPVLAPHAERVRHVGDRDDEPEPVHRVHVHRAVARELVDRAAHALVPVPRVRLGEVGAVLPDPPADVRAAPPARFRGGRGPARPELDHAPGGLLVQRRQRLRHQAPVRHRAETRARTRAPPPPARVEERRRERARKKERVQEADCGIVHERRRGRSRRFESRRVSFFSAKIGLLETLVRSLAMTRERTGSSDPGTPRSRKEVSSSPSLRGVHRSPPPHGR